MTRYLVQMKPTKLDHIIAMVALYRPGPMAHIQDYIDRMHGKARNRVPAVQPWHRSLTPHWHSGCTRNS